MKISEYMLNHDKYKIDRTYQRPAGAWNRKDKQCLIDTIMRDEPIPLFFMNYKTQEDVFYIVDGQQRLEAISDFVENKFPLSEEFSSKELAGKKFKDLTTQERERFQSYNLQVKMLEDYDDERVRLIFSRLQRGKPLGMGERLNAKPGKIVYVMRKLADHDFIAKSIGVNKSRFKTYEDVSRIIFYEKYGPKECSNGPIYELFEKDKDMDTDSYVYKKINNVLNFLLKCFPADPGNYKYLEKHAWVQALYMAISDLRTTHALNGKEEEIRNFIQKFHTKVYSEDWRVSNIKINHFYDSVRGGWAERLNLIRRDTLKEFMISELKLVELDVNRQITDEQKIAAYGRANMKCQRCGKEFKDYREAEYHHIELYSLGGETKESNIEVLCRECHDDIHRNKVEEKTAINTSGDTEEETEE